MVMHRALHSGFSSIAITAVLSVMLLLGAILWKMEEPATPVTAPTSATASTTPNTDASTTAPEDDAINELLNASSSGITPLGAEVMGQMSNAYADATKDGPLTNTSAATAAQEILANIRPDITYRHFTAADVLAESDDSKAAVSKYRSDLQVSLKPLMSITELELATYGRYVQTKDTTYLTQLQNDAGKYRAAIDATALVKVPSDAVDVQVGILNAMGEFAGTLDALVQNASDPLASAMLLKNYNRAQNDMMSSFNALAAYYKSRLL